MPCVKTVVARECGAFMAARETSLRFQLICFLYLVAAKVTR
jgi:hypothetical protein